MMENVPAETFSKELKSLGEAHISSALAPNLGIASNVNRAGDVEKLIPRQRTHLEQAAGELAVSYPQAS